LRLTQAHGAHQLRAVSRISNDFIVLPTSPSDSRRGAANLAAQLRRLDSAGRGVIFARTGRLPAAGGIRA
jgi:hypothetical protein